MVGFATSVGQASQEVIGPMPASDEESGTSSRRRGRTVRHWPHFLSLAAAIIGALFAILAIVFQLRAESPNPSTTEPTSVTRTGPSARNATTVRISFPHDRERVPGSLSVRGTAENLQPSQSMWLVVVPAGTGLFYVQDGPMNVGSGGSWASVSVSLGDKQISIGQLFTLSVVVTNKQASATLQRYFSSSTRDEIALERLPPGAIEYDRVTAVRAR